MLVVHDRVGMAYMGHPFRSLLVPWCVFLSRSIDLRSPTVSPGGDLILGFFLSPAWGYGEPPVCGGALVLVLGVR